MLTSTLLLAGVALARAPQAPPPLAFINARVEIGNGQILDRATVLVRDGKIEAVGDSPAPANVRVIDAAGLTIYPGFIDGCMTSGMKLPTPPAAGTPPNSNLSAPATMWDKNRKGIRSEVRVATSLDLAGSLKSWHAQGYTAALMLPGTGGSLRGTGALVQLREGKPEEVLLNADSAFEMSFRNGTGDGYPGSLLGVIALMRQTLYDGQGYGKATPATTDPALEGLQPVLGGKLPAAFNVDQRSEIVRATQIAKEFNLKPLFVGARDSFREVDRIKGMGASVLLNLNLGTEPSRTASTAPDSVPQEVLDFRYSVWLERASVAKTLHEASLPFGFCSPSTGVDDTLKNVRRVIELGLPRPAALKALTLGPAQILGVADRLGTIEVGKLAHLTIMNGDFAAPTTTVQMVVVGGTLVDLRKPEEKK